MSDGELKYLGVEIKKGTAQTCSHYLPKSQRGDFGKKSANLQEEIMDLGTGVAK